MGKKKEKDKINYYSLKRIMQYKARYYMVFGERSNGKTYAVMEYAIKRYFETGEEFALIRRQREDFIGKRGDMMFSNQVANGTVEKYSKGKYTGIKYRASRWYFTSPQYDDKDDIIKEIPMEKPFAYGFALSSMEHDKSTSFPNVTTVLFDEFLSRDGYLNDEFVLLMNTLSTIIRERVDVTIFMMGNTVNKYCPYFSEMGITNVKKMEQGDIDIYEYGDSGLRVAVEYAPSIKSQKKSNVYFAFDNPKLKMITGGDWELDIYPHCPYKYRPKDIALTYFIQFSGDTLQCEIVNTDNVSFTFVHIKTTPIQDDDNDIIFGTEASPKYNHALKINVNNFGELSKRIYWYYQSGKVFYQSNEIGEIMRNYLDWCGV